MYTILDTNILVHTLRNTTLYKEVIMDYDPWVLGEKVIISSVTVGELYSLAKRNNWGKARINQMNDILSKIQIYPVSGDDLYESYAEIDTFSQGKLDYLPLGRSAINMGKNDLWIAATTAVFQGTLLTTDKDFNHLNNIFIKVMGV